MKKKISSLTGLSTTIAPFLLWQEGKRNITLLFPINFNMVTVSYLQHTSITTILIFAGLSLPIYLTRPLLNAFLYPNQSF